MPLLSKFSAVRKTQFFLKSIPKHYNILEVGCGTGWAGKYLKQNGWSNYTGIDLNPPADIVGDIRDWEKIGIRRESFDVILAFEVVEHGDFYKEFHDILKPGGLLMLTSPVPHMDWFLNILEIIGLNQKRTGPHTHLIYLNKVPYFRLVKLTTIVGVNQWAIFVK